MDLEGFSDLSLKANKIIPVTAQCSVFAESEVISLLAKRNPPEDVAAGIQKAVALRVLRTSQADRHALPGDNHRRVCKKPGPYQGPFRSNQHRRDIAPGRSANYRSARRGCVFPQSIKEKISFKRVSNQS
jgi:hypothetical protein